MKLNNIALKGWDKDLPFTVKLQSCEKMQKNN